MGSQYHITSICKTCGKAFPFYATPSKVAAGHGQFCSGKCRSQWQLEHPYKKRPSNFDAVHKCEACGHDFPFRAFPSQVALGRGRFCSKTCQKAWQTIPLKERFEKYVGQKTESGCIPWIGAVDAGGYGVIGSGTQNGRNLMAHRVAYEFYVGPIPDGLSVLHRCDNPICINAIDHLFLGTQADNMADKCAKKRGACGEKCHSAKLTDDIVRKSREEYASGNTSYKALAAEYGVHTQVIKKAIQRETWKHVL